MRQTAQLALLFALLAPAVRAQAPGTAHAAPRQRPWLDANGEPLPLHSDDEVADFLRSAAVVEEQPIARGVGGARKLRLERDGVEVHAVFRSVVDEARERRVEGRLIRFFRDHYANEPAAYALSERLGLEMVPPAVERMLRGGRTGSLQIWIKSAMTDAERAQKGLEPPDQVRFALQLHQMRVFDNLVGNIDRNQGNILIDAQWRMWLIDHTRAFMRERSLVAPELVRRVERGLWERLRTISDEQLDATVAPWVPLPERAALLERRRLLVELIEEKIELVGEDAVLWTAEGPP